MIKKYMVSNVRIIQKALVVFNGKILVVKRSDNDETRPSAWDFPGGNVDNGDVENTKESILLKALSRELIEEVGLNVSLNDIEPFYIGEGWQSTDGNLVVWIGYKINLNEDLEVKLSDEHTEYGWVTKEEFQDLDFGDPYGLFLKVGNKVFI
jgi:8-oxo-dGTP diphosphatase